MGRWTGWSEFVLNIQNSPSSSWVGFLLSFVCIKTDLDSSIYRSVSGVIDLQTLASFSNLIFADLTNKN